MPLELIGRSPYGPTTLTPISRSQPVPRLSQVSRADAPEGIVTTMYDYIFGDRDPVAEPGLPNGTTGDWWTVVAQSP